MDIRESKDREVLLEQYLLEAVERFQQDGGIQPGEVCASEIIIGATEKPIVAAKLVDEPTTFPGISLNHLVIHEINSITGYIEASLIDNAGIGSSSKSAFSKMDALWLHGTYKKPGGASYTILGSTSTTSIKIKNSKTGKVRNVPREEAGKAIAENGLTTKNGQFIPPTTSKAVLQSVKEMEYADMYRGILAHWNMRGKGDVNNIGRTFNDGKKCVGVFLGAKVQGYYGKAPGELYVKRFSDDKVVSYKITGWDDPTAYVVGDDGVMHQLFQ